MRRRLICRWMWGRAVNIVTLPAIALAELSSKLKGPKQMGGPLIRAPQAPTLCCGLRCAAFS
jgi:hypothetical protein